MKLKLKLFLATALAIILFPATASAASFSVRIGQPKSPTNQNNFKLTFVALDTQQSGRNITVKCFKKGPSEGSFSQFDTEKILIEGGNTDYCNVNDSILNSNGTYSFYVSAEVPSEPVMNSNTVSVDFNTSGPSTPVSYSKERLNSCDYKIKFKTADDSKTVKVQLFRSDNLNISVGSSSVIAGINIGPNTEGEIVNSVPDCNKDYYYVIRAVDGSDNASGTVGDSFTTTASTTTGSVGSTQNAPIVVSGGTSQVSAPSDTNATDSSAPATGDDIFVSPTPEILGSSTDTQKSVSKWILLLVALFAGYFFSRLLRRFKK